MSIKSSMSIPDSFTKSEKEKVEILKTHFEEKTKALQQSLSKVNKQFREALKKHEKECSGFETKIQLRKAKIDKLDAVFEISKTNFEESLVALRSEETQTKLNIDEIKEFHRLEQIQNNKSRVESLEGQLNCIRKKLEAERLVELKWNIFGTTERLQLVESISSAEVRLRLQEEERHRWTSLSQEVSRRMWQQEDKLRAQAARQEELCAVEDQTRRQEALAPAEDKLVTLQAKQLKVETNYADLVREHEANRSKLIREEELAKDQLQNCIDKHNVNIENLKKAIVEFQEIIASLSFRMDDELFYLIQEILSKRQWSVELSREMDLLKVGQQMNRPWKNSPYIMWPVELIERPFGGGRARQKEFKFGKKPKPLPDIATDKLN